MTRRQRLHRKSAKLRWLVASKMQLSQLLQLGRGCRSCGPSRSASPFFVGIDNAAPPASCATVCTLPNTTAIVNILVYASCLGVRISIWKVDCWVAWPSLHRPKKKGTMANCFLVSAVTLQFRSKSNATAGTGCVGMVDPWQLW